MPPQLSVCWHSALPCLPAFSHTLHQLGACRMFWESALLLCVQRSVLEPMLQAYQCVPWLSGLLNWSLLGAGSSRVGIRFPALHIIVHIIVEPRALMCLGYPCRMLVPRLCVVPAFIDITRAAPPNSVANAQRNGFFWHGVVYLVPSVPRWR